MLGREHAIGHPALTDRNTGLANVLHFELVYSYLFYGADRGVSLALMLVSVSNTAPEELRVFGKRIQQTTRSADLVAYLGHGRFAVLLLGSNLPGGRIAADRVETALNDIVGSPISVGLAAYQPTMKEPSELLEAVDRALRKAEEAGGGLEMV